MYIEMRAKLTRGIGAWPAFWLNPGVQRADGTFSELPWPPEIDIFEFFNWQGRARTRVMTAYVQTAGKPEKYGQPRDLHSQFVRGEYVPGPDFSREFHTFALDWRKDTPSWLLDGQAIKQTHYEWRAPPAHILVTNQVGMTLPGVDVSHMKADESQWDYVIDYIRVFRRLNP
jgi:beta-glucanase (GH16 family)